MKSDAGMPAPASVGALPLAERRIPTLPCSTAGFVGLAPGGPTGEPRRVESFEQFAAAFSDPSQPRSGPFAPDAKLAHAVRGFFVNGGRVCWVVRASGSAGSAQAGGVVDGLRALAALDEPTAIAVPDAHALVGEQDAAIVQRELVASCEKVVGRIAVIDPPPGLDPEAALEWRAQTRIDSPAAVAYFPWIEVPDPTSGRTAPAPPCGHVLGMWARVDGRAGGPQRAPTGEALLAIDAAAIGLTAPEQHRLNRAGVNCLRAWPGPELRAWGARTLCADAELRYLHRQRVVGHLAASIAHGTRWALDEPDPGRRREQLRATVTAFLGSAWRAGALQGDSPGQAFYVRCDDELDAEGAHARDDVVLEVGLAVRRAGDFRVLRIAHRGDARMHP